MTDPTKEFLNRLLATFRIEAAEHLQDIISNIVLLERASESVRGEVIARLLRRLHTFKGAARAVNLGDIEALCHSMESVFSALQNSGQPLAPEQFDLIHQAGNVIRSLLEQPSGRIRNQATALAQRLERLSADLAARAPEPELAREPELTPEPEPALEESERPVQPQPGVPATALGDVIRVRGRSLDTIRYQAEALLPVELQLQHHIADLIRLADDMADEMAGPAERHRLARAEGGEDGALVLQEPQDEDIERRCRRLANALRKTHRNFSVIRSRLMEATLETVLAPFAAALDQLPGLVRNLARNLGKDAILQVQGESIEIDRRVLDVVRDTVMHLVTNAVAHGIEPIEKRQVAGKPTAGTIRVGTEQLGGNRLSVTVADDGAGIDVDAVVEAALNSGTLDKEQLAGLDERQKLRLALHAGVSTSPQLTQVAGRGVGLSVVAEKVASVGGELLIENKPGAGCTFEMLLPVQLATLRALLLRTQGARFIFPLSGLEAVRAVRDEDLRTVEGRETLLFGSQVIPAVRLGRLLGLGAGDVPSGRHDDERIAVIAANGHGLFALIVDELLAEQEVLPKSLGKHLRRVRYIAGATQLGDGSLVPILALEDIAKFGLAAEEGFAPAAGEAGPAASGSKVLVVEDSITSRLLLKHILEGAGYQVDTAVDGLDALSRLRHEEFAAVVSDIEMPNMDGLALTERIRANPKTEDLPVILVTSLQSPEEKERGLRAGADAYVIKASFDQDNLLATVRRLI
jgi:two-component system chemotaxis sensor kinase CheA